jgi:hypothetical protein
VAEGGLKINPLWAAYGDAWVRPTAGQYGGDIGARYKSKLDLFAGGQSNTKGEWQATAGIKLRF